MPVPTFLRPALAALPLLLAAGAGLAAASSSAVVETEGGTVRLVTAGLAGPDGRLRGAIEVVLRPGWKTYWLDPGSSGVPPQIEIGRSINVGAAEIGFPRPAWHEDGYGAWAGYAGSVGLPVTFSIPAPDRYALIEADLFLGICQTICIPVQATLEVEPGSAPDDPADTTIVDAAFAALPPPPREGFRLVLESAEAGRLVLAAELPEGGGEPELFLAGADGYVFGRPRRLDRGGPAAFEVPLLAAPAAPETAAAIPYLLAAGRKAVAGTLALP